MEGKELITLIDSLPDKEFTAKSPVFLICIDPSQLEGIDKVGRVNYANLFKALLATLEDTYQPTNENLTEIAATEPNDGDFLYYEVNKWVTKTTAEVADLVGVDQKQILKRTLGS